MPNREIHNELHFVPLIAPIAARTDNTAIVSSIIDTLGYNAAEFVLVTGTNTDANATFAVTVDEGDNSALSDAAAVATSQLVGTLALASFTFADDVECRKIGYIGTKRYVRVTVTPSGNDSGNIFISGIAVLGHPATGPTANPPQ
ncbi:hypothetical protein OIU34_28030 [Pararhizobium sp. BT-229]|uniref:hypothetical protein n=1 Tax=Pararhizobium sp. BT-229 TaxID=2986923 RepID=UPI0021F79C69|nr:hypothetical protein [Pararhizobium sp. BT-229]MCV9965724.1 hypothetical protein [Pararhizobium sp. BT-229]